MAPVKYRSDVQTSLPGTAADVGGLLRQKAAAPIKPRKPQVPCDHGLFSDEADQLDLCEMFHDSTEEE
jgi:hypothetical protein